MTLKERQDSNEPAAWFKQAAERLRCARLVSISEENKGQATISLLHRSVELYLKGYLFALGWQQEKTKNLVKLLEIISERDSRFVAFKTIFSELNHDFRLIQYPGKDWRKVSNHFTEQLTTTERLEALIRQTFPQFFTAIQ